MKQSPIRLRRPKDREIRMKHFMYNNPIKPELGSGNDATYNGDPLRRMDNAAKLVATQLEACVKKGQYLEAKKLLESSPESTDNIETEFTSLDPVVLAVDCKQEALALYLIEKGFTFSNIYRYPDQTCDQWCVNKHKKERCPTKYDALSLAQRRGLSRVVSLIADIEKEGRKQGAELSSSLSGPHAIMGKNANGASTRNSTESITREENGYKTQADLAKEKLVELGSRYITKEGDTLIHLSVEFGPALVYVSADAGVPTNTQNFEGDTALHVAIRENRRDVAVALLVCGADLTLRNKLGLTPLDQSSGELKALLDKFRPGLPQAASKAEHGAMQRLVRLWCHPHSIIKDGMSAVQLLQARADSDSNAEKCLNLLKHNLKTLELVHAVLCEDLLQTQKILRDEKGWNINVRFGDRKGKTPVSCAVEQGNLALLQLLVDTGKYQFNTRVSDTDFSEQTVPLCFKSLSQDNPLEILQLVQKYSDPEQIAEKDTNGNTCVFHALEKDKPAEFIDAMIRASSGSCIMHRNKSGQTLRERALELQKHDIVDVIDRSVCELVGNSFLMYLPVRFYGQDNMSISLHGQSLLNLVEESKREEDIQAVKNYASAEKLGIRLFKAAARGDLKKIAQLNTASYQDKNGYTALIRAIVFNQARAAEILITERPGLKAIGDNCNRRPLHYAYALPDAQSKVFVEVLLERNPEDIEHRVDKDGREGVEYKDLRGTAEVLQMFNDARTLDAYGQRVQPLGPLPEDAVPVPDLQNSES